MKRILLSGLVAGLILNIGEAALHAGVLGEATPAALQALGRTDPGPGLGLVALIVMTFVQGIVGMRLYASWPSWIGVGLVVWFLSALYSGVYLWAGYPGVLPANVVWIPVAWGVVQYPLATLAGSAVFRKLS